MGRFFPYTAQDVNGEPISGAELVTTVLDSTTPLAVYTDSATTIPATNPKIADSAGRIRVYFKSGLDYSLSITDPATGQSLLQGDIVDGEMVNVIASEAGYNSLISSLEDLIADIESLGNVQAYTDDQFDGDGATTAFTLTSVGSTRGSTEVYLHGVRQCSGDDYTISGNTLTFLEAPAAAAKIRTRSWQFAAAGVVDLSEYASLSDMLSHARQVTNKTTVRALSTTQRTGMVRALGDTTAADRGGGNYRWLSGDQSSRIDGQDYNGIWITPDDAPSGVSGAFQLEGDYITPDDYGCQGDGSTDDTARFQRALEAAIRYRIPLVLPWDREYGLTNVVIDGTNDDSFPVYTEILKVFGWGGSIRSLTAGKTLSITGLHKPYFDNVDFIGSFDEDAGVYDAADPQACLYLNHCSMPQVVHNRFRGGSGFYLWVDRSQPATRHLGAGVMSNLFSDMAYDAGSNKQACIYLGDNGEYNLINSNKMEGCPSFVRAQAGANTKIIDNDLMGSNYTGGVSSSHGLILFDATGTTSNEGKIDISGNRINHIEVADYLINIAGSGTSGFTNNQNRIVGNRMLVCGDDDTTSGAEFIRIKNYANNLIDKNHFRSRVNSPGRGYAVTLDGASARARGNYFEQHSDECWRIGAGATIHDDGNDYKDTALRYSVSGTGTNAVYVRGVQKDAVWTPVLTFATPGDSVIATVGPIGTYDLNEVDMVDFRLHLNVGTNNYTTALGDIQITAPFEADGDFSFALSHVEKLTIGASVVNVSASIADGDSHFTIHLGASGGAGATAGPTEMPANVSNFIIEFSGTYKRAV